MNAWTQLAMTARRIAAAERLRAVEFDAEPANPRQSAARDEELAQVNEERARDLSDLLAAVRAVMADNLTMDCPQCGASGEEPCRDYCTAPDGLTVQVIRTK